MVSEEPVAYFVEDMACADVIVVGVAVHVSQRSSGRRRTRVRRRPCPWSRRHVLAPGHPFEEGSGSFHAS